MHKYAKEMMAMAEAAKTSDEPWQVLQVFNFDGEWKDMTQMPNFNITTRYRIKPKEKKKLWLWVTLNTNGNLTTGRFIKEGTETAENTTGWVKTNTFIEIEGE